MPHYFNTHSYLLWSHSTFDGLLDDSKEESKAITYLNLKNL